ncbi:MAG TPA: hypothetical protein VEC19_08830 [Usitatibacter sp.]|nr:hypothetical protein [Usitatibacter sp.]
MSRAVISKTVIDSLIRAKLASLENCAGVEPLPVAWNENALKGCNWVVPGWIGDSRVVKGCVERLSDYVTFLQAQFDIPPERP